MGRRLLRQPAYLAIVLEVSGFADRPRGRGADKLFFSCVEVLTTVTAAIHGRATPINLGGLTLS